MSTALLERAGELEALDAALAAASGGHGGVVLLAGEAGIGKTSLIRSFLDRVPAGTRVLVGACDDLVTPRTLGAVRDAFAGHSGRLDGLLAEGSRDDVLVGVLAELVDGDRPTVLVVEDVHWADDATLDVLRYVSRRIERTSAVLVVSYRDDEVGRDHPAQRLLGGLAGTSVRRVVVPRLSHAAVAALAGARSVQLFALTGGNPFYVTEVLAAGDDAGDDTVPLTVADAVMARVHGLPPATRTALEQLAVVPSQVELPLARALVGDLTVLAEAERRGVLEVRPDAVAFRHELARRAVEDALPASERMRSHTAVLEALLARDGVDLPRVLHHAVEAADDERVVEIAPRAAAQAARDGSYGQVVGCLRLLLAREHLVPAADVAAARHQLADALWAMDEPTEALEHGLAAVRILEELGDVVGLGEALIVLGPAQWSLALTADAKASLARAVALLESVPETPARTYALLWRSVLLAMVGGDDVLASAEAAAASAERTGTPEHLGMSLTCLGRARLIGGEHDAGLELMRDGLAATRAAGAHTFTLIAYGLLVLDLFALARYDECRRHLDEAIAYAEELETWFLATSWQAVGYRLRAVHGDWEGAIAGLRGIAGVRGEPERGSLRYALPPLARLLARRGDDDAAAHRAWACDLAARAECYDIWWASGLVEIETAWLAGRPSDADEALARLDELTARPGREHDRGELARWRRRLGSAVDVPDGARPVHAAGIRGDWAAAAAIWEAEGAPYHQALELLDSGAPDPTLRALRILDGLGARPAARLARQRLRALGVSHIPRGPYAATRANPAGLSDRQVEVVRLLAENLTNAEIAARLVISEKTADHHVSAILAKLEVRTRREAAARARELGVVPERRRTPRQGYG
ncbi:regulatory LuxR family protein [Actinomycetospora succinea]|uniref:Regulatory LuxR family protein n=1 Tax=Actinomycetospora succinea TaxID=663603 RepID=A0A4R6V265_9PSEU|nr:LuxR family transcriptional regulator [Actinomycetospora succinea]TDQ50174.1 regulatory LuxR family protein [Actinomycetospora succinea]